MVPNLEPNAVAFKVQLAELTSLIPSVPPSPIPKFASNIPESKFHASGYGQDVRIAYDQAIAQRRQLLTQKAWVEETLSSISFALDKHSLFIKEHKPLLSSYRRLPPEIWSMIFKEAALADARTDAGRIFLNPDKTMAPFSISHVCAEWRKLCLQSPTLWTSLRLRIETQFPASKRKLLDAFMARGRNGPLDISLVFENSPSTAKMINSPSIRWCYNLSDSLHPLFREHLRWRSADICIPVTFLLRGSLFPIADTPLLESFRLEMLSSGLQRQTLPAMPQSILQSSPALRKLVLSKFFTNFDGCTLDNLSSLLDWSNLASFSLSDPNGPCLNVMDESGSIKLGQSLLALCPSLKSWNWSFSRPPTVTNGTDTRISHSNLHSAYLDAWDEVVFSHLEFPSLKFFCLKNMDFDDLPAENIRKFLRRSPFLEKIELEWSSFVSLAVLDDIGLSLKEITIRCQSSSSVRDYSYGSKISILTRENIPTLQRVTFVIQPFPNENPTRFVSAIAAARELALYTETRTYHTTISIEAHLRELEDSIKEALTSLEDLGLPNLEISRVKPLALDNSV
ncbi:hypothetical protein DL96DRAFT_1631988 [Flagelloscypha sp. PMI_526]|nr:hypothetical protein DL96DRAFT_1631988 [Flagelloscypha sp. PMI_526]